MIMLCGLTFVSLVRASSTQVVSVLVPAWAGWRDTGIDIARDQRVSVVAYGSWTLGGHPPTYTEAKGFEGVTHKDAIVPAAPLGALVGRVASDKFVAVGALPEGLSGRLYLGINDVDGSFRDNAGQLVVTVTLRAGAEK